MTGKLVVQTGVPMPKANRARPGVRRKYPLDVMAVDQFVFSPGGVSKLVSAYISRTTKDMPQKFSVRHCWAIQNDGKWKLVDQGTEGAVEGCGIWRIE